MNQPNTTTFPDWMMKPTPISCITETLALKRDKLKEYDPEKGLMLYRKQKLTKNQKEESLFDENGEIPKKQLS